ncbi:hypothetical protein JCM16303_007302 [Sporobolomyces ruberrimus]
MPAADYKHKPGGGLKLKGADPTKKKKKKSSTSKKVREGDEEESRELVKGSGDRGDRSESPVVASGSASRGSEKTKAQLRFEEVQRQRLLERASKAALKSHKDRVAEFNEQLESQSPHYDIPKASFYDPGAIFQTADTSLVTVDPTAIRLALSYRSDAVS